MFFERYDSKKYAMENDDYIYSIKKKMIRRSCNRYGVDAENAIMGNNTISVPVGVNDLYLVFDNDCNILEIDKFNSKDKEIVKCYFDTRYSIDNYKKENYDCFDINDIDNYILTLIQNVSDNLFDLMKVDYFLLSLTQIISDKCTFEGICCKLNGEKVADNFLREQLSYYKFLGEEIKYYSKFSLGMQKMGYDMPSILNYINSLIGQLNTYIDTCIEENRRPYAFGFLFSIGQGDLSVEEIVLDNIFVTLLRDKGYEIDYMNNSVKKIDNAEKQK